MVFQSHGFSEAKLKARVHCVIVGFSVAPNDKPRKLFASDRLQEVRNINGYPLDASTVFVERRAKPLCAVPEIYRGSQPTDNGNLILTAEEKDALLASEPQAGAIHSPAYDGQGFHWPKAALLPVACGREFHGLEAMPVGNVQSIAYFQCVK